MLIDTRTGAARTMTRAPRVHEAVCWSPDGRWLCGVVEEELRRAEIVLADRETGEVEETTAGRPPARRRPFGFSADGSSLYLLTDEGREHLGLARLDLRARKLDWLKLPDWDIDLACMSADGRWILYFVNEDSIHRAHLLDRNSGTEPELPPLPMGACHAASIAADGSRAALVHSTARRPAEVCLLDLPRRALRTITHGMVGGVPAEEMIEPEVVRYDSFDRKIPALLYVPRRKPGSGGFPALLSLHGGPGAQERPDYHPLYQFLLSRGVLVLAPNIRGSTGFGRAYHDLLRRDVGVGDVRDCAAAADWLRARPDVDARRIGVFGESYGGFLALSCA
ncbi:MAG: S9 family peptidase, partial [Planctomycetota bacterium]